jgi:hypothetical protein
MRATRQAAQRSRRFSEEGLSEPGAGASSGAPGRLVDATRTT